MKQLKVESVKMNYNFLIFTSGHWKGYGEFTIEGNIEGKFELIFNNKYQNEYILSTELVNYKKIRSKTFGTMKSDVNNQVLELLKPIVENQITEIRLTEAYMVKPFVQFFEPKYTNERYEIPFIIGNEPIKYLWVSKDNKDEWFYVTSHHDFYTSCDIDFSSWLSYVWEKLKESEYMRLPFLL